MRPRRASPTLGRPGPPESHRRAERESVRRQQFQRVKEVRTMSIEQNKTVVRRFISDVLTGGNLDQIDELLAPNYTNRGMGGLDRAAFKEALGGIAAALP